MLLPHNRETQKEKYIVVKKIKKRESKAMTKQIKNTNIFLSDEEKKLYLDNLHGNCDSFKRLEKIVKKCKKVSGYKTDNIDSSISSKLFRQELKLKEIVLLLRQ